MDESSLELIYSLVTSRVKILLLMSYRPQESTPKLNEIVEMDVATVHHVRLEALDFDSMVDYICDALHRRRREDDTVDRTSVLPLAEVAYKKTRGNAFYFSQLLLTLEKSKLIFFNWEANEWDYHLAEIQQTVLTHEDAETESELDVDFLVSRLRELPSDGQHLLKWASFVGDTFSWQTVKHLMTHSDSESDETPVPYMKRLRLKTKTKKKGNCRGRTFQSPMQPTKLGRRKRSIVLHSPRAILSTVYKPRSKKAILCRSTGTNSVDARPVLAGSHGAQQPNVTRRHPFQDCAIPYESAPCRQLYRVGPFAKMHEYRALLSKEMRTATFSSGRETVHGHRVRIPRRLPTTCLRSSC